MTPTARPLTTTLAPCGVEVIERSPTNRTGAAGGAVASSVVRAAALRLGAGAELDVSSAASTDWLVGWVSLWSLRERRRFDDRPGGLLFCAWG